MTNGSTRARAALIVGGSDVRVWGLGSRARLQRTFDRQDLGPADRLAPEDGVVIAHAGWVFDESLIRALAARPGAVLADRSGRPAAAHVPAGEAAATAKLLEAGAALPGPALSAMELSGAYNSELRKREPPILEPLTSGNVGGVERRLFQGSYKGVTDLVTKYVWPRPARIVTRWCALAGITPNQVTFASLVLVIAAFALFWTGHFGWGLAAAWVMTFLDTVDGKLARVTLRSSRFGNILDHGIDLVHPPFWWAAWVAGVQASDHPLADPGPILWMVVGGYVAQRLLEGLFLGAFKVEMHAWRPFDSFFRLIAARRNPNLILLTLAALAGYPHAGAVAVAAWTAVSLVVHVVQCLQAFAAPRGAVVSWLSR